MGNTKGVFDLPDPTVTPRRGFKALSSSPTAGSSGPELQPAHAWWSEISLGSKRSRVSIVTLPGG